MDRIYEVFQFFEVEPSIVFFMLLMACIVSSPQTVAFVELDNSLRAPSVEVNLILKIENTSLEVRYIYMYVCIDMFKNGQIRLDIACNKVIMAICVTSVI